MLITNHLLKTDVKLIEHAPAVRKINKILGEKHYFLLTSESHKKKTAGSIIQWVQWVGSASLDLHQKKVTDPDHCCVSYKRD